MSINGAGLRKVDSGLKKIDQTHIVLASGKLVLQNSFITLATDGKNTCNYAFFQIDPKLFFKSYFQWNSIPSGKWNIDLS